MGTVWEATHEITHARVALKFLTGAPQRDDLRKRFLSEARATHLVDHPNVVAVRDVFALEDATLVMVLDLLEGETLGQRLARDEVLSLETTCELLVPIVAAMRAAHAQSVIHRDLNPNNMILAQSDGEVRPMVLDFGLAKLVAEDGDGPPVTSTGMSIGTPGYTAPEQGFGESDIDYRADVWSLGAVLYRCLTGGVVIEGSNMGQYLKGLATEPIAPLGELEPDLPTVLCDIIDAMLHLKPEKRPELETVERVLSTPIDELEDMSSALAPPSPAGGLSQELSTVLGGAIHHGPEAQDSEALTPAVGRPSSAKRRWIALAALAAVIGVVALVMVPDALSTDTSTPARTMPAPRVSSAHPMASTTVAQAAPDPAATLSDRSSSTASALPTATIVAPAPGTSHAAALPSPTRALVPPPAPRTPPPPPPATRSPLRTPTGLETADPF